MDKVISLATWLLNNYQQVIVDLNAILVALIAFFAIIPGDQPEKFLQVCVDFLAKFSAKPNVPPAPPAGSPAAVESLPKE